LCSIQANRSEDSYRCNFCAGVLETHHSPAQNEAEQSLANEIRVKGAEMKLSDKEPSIKVKDAQGVRNAIIGEDVKLADGTEYQVRKDFSLKRTSKKFSGKERREIRRQKRQESYR
jgi:hypothetical protein